MRWRRRSDNHPNYLPEMPAKIIRIVFVILLLFASFVMLRITLPYLSFNTTVDFLKTKQGIIHLSFWRYAFYAHVMSSVIVLFCGIFQFLPGILNRYPKWHRGAGKLYVILVVCVSGPGGLIMGFFANGGWPARISFVLLSLCWIYSTAQAYVRARQRSFDAHRAFMIRSYALTLSAITLRSYAFILPSLIVLKPRSEYILIAWMSWLPNLIVAEGIIRYRRNRKEFNSFLQIQASPDQVE
jgi:uncharacterized membrane protein